jgi:hypothetical protein
MKLNGSYDHSAGKKIAGTPSSHASSAASSRAKSPLAAERASGAAAAAVRPIEGEVCGFRKPAFYNAVFDVACVASSMAMMAVGHLRSKDALKTAGISLYCFALLKRGLVGWLSHYPDHGTFVGGAACAASAAALFGFTYSVQGGGDATMATAKFAASAWIASLVVSTTALGGPRAALAMASRALGGARAIAAAAARLVPAYDRIAIAIISAVVLLSISAIGSAVGFGPLAAIAASARGIAGLARAYAWAGHAIPIAFATCARMVLLLRARQRNDPDAALRRDNLGCVSGILMLFSACLFTLGTLLVEFLSTMANDPRFADVYVFALSQFTAVTAACAAAAIGCDGAEIAREFSGCGRPAADEAAHDSGDDDD